MNKAEQRHPSHHALKVDRDQSLGCQRGRELGSEDRNALYESRVLKMFGLKCLPLLDDVCISSFYVCCPHGCNPPSLLCSIQCSTLCLKIQKLQTLHHNIFRTLAFHRIPSICPSPSVMKPSSSSMCTLYLL